MANDVMTTEEVARRLRVPDARVRQLLIGQRLRGVKFGSCWAVSEEDLADFIAIERKRWTGGTVGRPPNFLKKLQNR